MKTLVFLLIALLAAVNAAFLGASDYPCTDNVFTGSDNHSPCRCCSIDCNKILIFKKGFDNNFLEGVKKNKAPVELKSEESTCKKRYYNYGCHLKSHCIRNIRFNEWLLGAAYCLMHNGCEVAPQFHSSFDSYNQTLAAIQTSLYPPIAPSKKVYTKEELESVALDYLHAEAAPIFFNFKQVQDVKEAIYTYNLSYDQFLKTSMAQMPYKRVPAHVLNAVKARFPDKFYYDSVKASVDAIAAVKKIAPQNVYLPIEESWKKIKDTVDDYLDEISGEINQYVVCTEKALKDHKAVVPSICYKNQLKADTLPQCNDNDSVDCGTKLFNGINAYKAQARSIMKELAANAVYYGTPVNWETFKKDNMPDPRGANIDNDAVVSSDPIAKNVGDLNNQVINGNPNNAANPTPTTAPKLVYIHNDGTMATAKPKLEIRIPNIVKILLKKVKSHNKKIKQLKKNAKKKKSKKNSKKQTKKNNKKSTGKKPKENKKKNKKTAAPKPAKKAAVNKKTTPKKK